MILKKWLQPLLAGSIILDRWLQPNFPSMTKNKFWEFAMRKEAEFDTVQKVVATVGYHVVNHGKGLQPHFRVAQ